MSTPRKSKSVDPMKAAETVAYALLRKYPPKGPWNVVGVRFRRLDARTVTEASKELLKHIKKHGYAELTSPDPKSIPGADICGPVRVSYDIQCDEIQFSVLAR